jgi:hypothetical protein
MTPRERWLVILQGRCPDRVPCDYWGTPEVTERLLRELACSSERELWERLGVDRMARVAALHPEAREKTW